MRGLQVPQIINRTRKRHLIDLTYGIWLMAYSLNMSQMEHGCSAVGRAYTDLGGSNTDLPRQRRFPLNIDIKRHKNNHTQSEQIIILPMAYGLKPEIRNDGEGVLRKEACEKPCRTATRYCYIAYLQGCGRAPPCRFLSMCIEKRSFLPVKKWKLKNHPTGKVSEKR